VWVRARVCVCFATERERRSRNNQDMEHYSLPSAPLPGKIKKQSRAYVGRHSYLYQAAQQANHKNTVYWIPKVMGNLGAYPAYLKY